MSDILDRIADASRLRILADWFDRYDERRGHYDNSVQRDLRRIADYLEADGPDEPRRAPRTIGRPR